mgnify:CR=1 FL=1
MVHRRHSLLKRNPNHSRQEFSRYYEHHHGPLAANLPGFRKFSARYVQNHVEELPNGAEPLFDGVTMTTQVPRDDYTRGFFNEPDYEKVKPDAIYLFDMTKTVSVLGREDPTISGPTSPYKALILAQTGTLAAMRMPAPSSVVLNHLDRSTASALGFRAGTFDYELLVEVWFAHADERRRAFDTVVAFSRDHGDTSVFLPVREVLIFGPEKPWREN